MDTQTKDLAYYLSLDYEFRVIPDDGSFFVHYPDLPGCMTQVEDATDIPAMAQEIKELWLETALEDGMTIPEPVTSTFSGRFVVRLPKSLHASLVHRAEAEGVSLNTHVVTLLSGGLEASALIQQLDERLEALQHRVASSALDDAVSAKTSRPSRLRAVKTR